MKTGYKWTVRIDFSPRSWTAFNSAVSSGVIARLKRVLHSARKRSICSRLKTVSPYLSMEVSMGNAVASGIQIQQPVEEILLVGYQVDLLP
jgi:hypothetical protein